MWPCIVINFFIIRPTRYTNFTNLFLALNSTCFGQFLCPSSGVYSLYTQQWYMSYRFVDSFRAGSGWNSMEFHPDTGFIGEFWWGLCESYCCCCCCCCYCCFCCCCCCCCCSYDRWWRTYLIIALASQKNLVCLNIIPSTLHYESIKGYDTCTHSIVQAAGWHLRGKECSNFDIWKAFKTNFLIKRVVWTHHKVCQYTQ